MNEELVIGVGEFLGRIEKDSPDLITRSDFLQAVFAKVKYFRKCCKCERKKVLGEINSIMAQAPDRLTDEIKLDIKNFLGAKVIIIKDGENQICQL
jgi:hypothetical protein